MRLLRVDPTEARRLTSKLSGGPLAPTVNQGTAPPAARPLERGGLGVMLPEQGLLVPSCSSVLHQRRNLHELDAGAYAVETRYALQKRIGEKGFG